PPRAHHPVGPRPAERGGSRTGHQCRIHPRPGPGPAPADPTAGPGFRPETGGRRIRRRGDPAQPPRTSRRARGDRLRIPPSHGRRGTRRRGGPVNPATATLVRDARIGDLPAILEIHNRAIAETTAIWDDEPVDLADRQAWFDNRTAHGRPIVVAEVDGELAGYASYGPWRPKSGYRHT